MPNPDKELTELQRAMIEHDEDAARLDRNTLGDLLMTKLTTASKELPAIGQRVRLLDDIWDDGCENHHPPGYLARRGEILIVRSLDPGHEHPVLISHEQITDRSFRVALSEIEAQQ